MNAWAPEHRLADYEGERARADPGRGRLAALHGRARPLAAPVVGLAVQAAAARAALRGASTATQPWFPRVPRAAGRRRRGLPRASSRALGAGDAEDVHWAVQHDLVAQLPLGARRPRRAAGGHARAAARATSASSPPGRPSRRNAGPLPLPPGAYDDAAAADRAAPLRAPTSAPIGYDDAPPDGGLARRLGARGPSRCSRCCAARSTSTLRIGQLHAARAAPRRAHARAPRRSSRPAPPAGRAPAAPRSSPTSRATRTSTCAGAGRRAARARA